MFWNGPNANLIAPFSVFVNGEPCVEDSNLDMNFIFVSCYNHPIGSYVDLVLPGNQRKLVVRQILAFQAHGMIKCTLFNWYKLIIRLNRSDFLVFNDKLARKNYLLSDKTDAEMIWECMGTLFGPGLSQNFATEDSVLLNNDRIFYARHGTEYKMVL